MEEEKIPAPFESQSENENSPKETEQIIQSAAPAPASVGGVRSFSIEDAFAFAWKTFKANKKLMLLLVVSFFSIIFLNSILQKSIEGRFVLSFMLTIVYVFVSVFISIGLIQIMLKICRGGQAKVSEMFGEKKYLWKFIGGSLVYGLIVVLGYLLFIIPGIIWQIKYGFYQYLIIDKNMGPIEAIKESGKMTYGFKWKIFFLQLSILGICLVGLLFFGIGVLVAYPVSLLMMVYVYRKLIGEQIEIAA